MDQRALTAAAALACVLAAVADARAEPAAERMHALSGGGALRVFQRTHQGHPVLGGRVAVRTDEGGRVLWQRARALDLAGLAAPRLGPDDALARARTSLDLPPGRGDGVRLAVDAPPSAAARWVYVVTLAEPAALRAHRALVDARTGAVLRADDLVARAAEAEVFAHSPAVDAAPERRPLSRLPAAAEHLASDQIEVLGCPDTAGCVEVFPRTFLHACVPTALAVADDAGDFLAYRYASDTDPEDAFAEVQAYAHLATSLDRLEALGVPLPGPLRVLVNYRQFDFGSLEDCADGRYDGDRELTPWNNAFYAPGGENVGVDLGDALVFGQGSSIDFSYDLDVVAHELGHALVAELAPDLGRGHVDDLGYDPTPAALHEAFPDLLALAVTGDAALGEYAGGGEPLRVIGGDGRCPDDLGRGLYADARLFSAPVAELRGSLDPAARDRLDAAVFTTLAALGAYADMGDAAEILVAELRATLGDAAADDLAARFSRRGLPGCGGRIVGASAARFALGSLGVPPRPTPGPLQFRVELSEPADALALEIAFVDVSVPPAEIAIDAVAKAGAPIQWRTTPAGAEGDHDAAAPLRVAGDGSAEARIPGPFAPGIYYLQLVNRGPRATIHDLRAGHVPADAGCGCSAANAGPAPWAALIVAALRRRRSSRRRRRSRRPPAPPPTPCSSC